jgi:hypothetical protein
VAGYTSRCAEACAPNPGDEAYGTGVSGLALLAFLGAGFTHLSRETYDGICFGDVVRKGLQRLMSRQDAEGGVGPRAAEKPMYNHALAALALSEAYGLTGSLLIRGSAQRAIDFLVAAQNPGSGWRYTARSGESDTSVTGWAVLALKSAEHSGLAFPRSAVDGARAWLDAVTDPETAAAGYTGRPSGRRPSGQFADPPTMTAAAASSRLLLGMEKGLAARGAGRLQEDLPSGDLPATDYYYWYRGTLAVFQ